MNTLALSNRTLAACLASTTLIAGAGCAQEVHDPAEWYPPGITTGEGLLAKEHLVRIEGLGEIRDAAMGKVGDDEQLHLIVSCNFGFVLLDPDSGAERKRVRFERTRFLGEKDSGARSQVLDVDEDGKLEFVRFGEHWVGRTSVHGADGKARWIHPDSDELAPNFTLCGDLDGDGAVEFLMSYNATSEVHLLGASGELIWKQNWSPGHSISSVRFCDTDGDGVQEILYVDGEALCVRAMSGRLISRVEPPDGGYVNALEVMDGFSEPPTRRLLVGAYLSEGALTGQQYYEFAPEGRRCLGKVTRLDRTAYFNVRALRLTGDAPGLLVGSDELNLQAFPAGYDATRLRLRIYDSDHQLVYEEVLKAVDREVSSGGVFVIAGAGKGGDRLMASYGPDLWEYSWPD